MLPMSIPSILMEGRSGTELDRAQMSEQGGETSFKRVAFIDSANDPNLAALQVVFRMVSGSLREVLSAPASAD